jgi:predicted extracellular nuclease
MKKTLLFLFALTISAVTIAQNQLFISEYVEGSGNNRALELYNPTSADVVLQDSGFRFVRYSNGGPTPYTVAITGTVPSKGTWVAVSDKRDPNGTGYDTMVDPALQAKADTFLCPSYSVNKTFYFNGNDAMTLELPNGVYVDIIGEIGVNPGDAWTMDASAGYTSALGGRWWTKNHTLIRKLSVKHGVTANPTPFIVGTEWDSLPKNTFIFLGSHTTSANIQNVKKTNNAFFYPNPSTNGWFMVKGTEIIESVEVLNVIGQSIVFLKNPAKRGDMRISTSDFTKGIYMVRINFADNSSIVKKIIIE